MTAYLSDSLKLALAQEHLTPFGHALAGALGGVFSNAVVYPLDTVKTRIQGTDESISRSDLPESAPSVKGAPTRKGKGILPLLLKIWKKDGLGGFYNGFGANMLNTFSMQFAYFYFHTFLRALTLRRLTKRAGKPIAQLSTSIELLLGALAGAFAQIFTIPVAVIATRQQLYEAPTTSGQPTAGGAGRGKPGRAPTFLETAHEIIDEDGIAGLWTGLKPGLVLTVNPAITYGVFERVKGVVVTAKGGDGRLTPGTAFLLGVLSKTLATVVTYPYIFAKVRLQAKQSAVPPGSPTGPRAASPAIGTASSSEGTAIPSYASVTSAGPPVQETPEQKEHAQHHFASTADLEANKAAVAGRRYTVFGKNRSRVKTASAVDILRATLEKEGVTGWYKGMQAQILKAVLSQGILFMAKSQFETYALLLILLAKRLVLRRVTAAAAAVSKV